MKNIVLNLLIRVGGAVFIISLLSACVTNGYRGGW